MGPIVSGNRPTYNGHTVNGGVTLLDGVYGVMDEFEKLPRGRFIQPIFFA